MAKKVFFSFQFKKDHWRAGQVRNIGTIEGNSEVSDNKWEQIKEEGDNAIKKWINDNMYGRSCLVVLIGNGTANRKWINYEIEKAWKDGKGVVGIYIHKLKNSDSEQDIQGNNPFDYIYHDGKKLSTIVKTFNSTYSGSTYVYDDIKENIVGLIDAAIEIRKKY
jgi:hypothetical protein